MVGCVRDCERASRDTLLLLEQNENLVVLLERFSASRGTFHSILVRRQKLPPKLSALMPSTGNGILRVLAYSVRSSYRTALVSTLMFLAHVPRDTQATYVLVWRTMGGAGDGSTIPCRMSAIECIANVLRNTSCCKTETGTSNAFLSTDCLSSEELFLRIACMKTCTGF